MTARKGVVAGMLGHPLVVALIGAIFAAYTGYLTGKATMEMRVTELEERADKIEAKQRGRTDFMTCAVRHLDALEGGGRVPDCKMTVPQ